METLGEVDYGLYGLVGGLTAFIVYFNNFLGGSIGRFYAVSVGRSTISGSDGIEDCRKWFNTAVFIHTIVPLVLVAIGYPLGCWAIENWLAIPSDRVGVCLNVFRLVCLSCFVGMVNVPFRAMYVAKQYIAELTIYSVVQTIINFLGVYLMVRNPGDWLFGYSLFVCLVSVLPQILIATRAMVVFTECKFRVRYLWSLSRLKSLFSFASWQAIGALGTLFRGQGMTIVVNKFFGGAAFNASMTIANTVNMQASTLSSSMLGAFWPAVTTAFGARNFELMKSLAFRAGKFSAVLSLLFLLPLSLELPYVINLWLKNPPPMVVPICWCLMVGLVFNNSSIGHSAAINAVGKVALYQTAMAVFPLLTVPLAIAFALFGLDIRAAAATIALSFVLSSFVRVFFARRIVGMSIRCWVCKVAIPITCAPLVVLAVGLMPRFVMAESFVRLCVTTALSEAVFVPLCWWGVLDNDERRFVFDKLMMLLNNARMRINGFD